MSDFTLSIPDENNTPNGGLTLNIPDEAWARFLLAAVKAHCLQTNRPLPKLMKQSEVQSEE